MKRLRMTPELVAKIKAAVGQDVEPENFAVFEVIALNTHPLPGKDGALFEKARVSQLTLHQMAESVQNGNTLPLQLNHDMSGMPVGRVFDAKLVMGDDGEPELRMLFYVDPTEEKLATKIDNASLDEVSVQFLASQIKCSECDFDYRGEEATWENFATRTCENGHTIGTDGVHVRLIGLAQFTELSLVSRGAASKPKIVGKSQSKLTAPLQALAARGFEVDELFLAASKGETQVDLSTVLAQLTEKTTEAATAAANVTLVTAERDGLKTQLEAANARIATLEAAAGEPNPDAETTAAALAAAEAGIEEAKTFLSDLFGKLATAAGETDVETPETITDLKAGIEARQSKLSAVLPIGGASATTVSDAPAVGAKFNASAASAFVA